MPRSWLASRCLSSMEHRAKSPSSHQTAPGRSQLVEYLLTLPHTYEQAQTVFQSRVCSRPACILPGSWAVSLSMATGLPITGDQVLDKLCTSALASATKALLHVPPDTSPSCLPHPMTMRRYSQTQMQSVGTQGLCQLTLEHVTAATSLRVLFRGMTVIPMTPTTHTEWHNAAHFPPCLPAGTGSVEVLYCILALQEWAAWSSQADAVQGER